MLGHGLVKVLVKKKLLTLNHLDQFFNQMLLLLKLKKALSQKNSGLLSEEKPNIQTQRH